MRWYRFFLAALTLWLGVSLAGAAPQITASMRVNPEGTLVFTITNIGQEPFPTYPPPYGNNEVRVVMPNGQPWVNMIRLDMSARLLAPGATRVDKWQFERFARHNSGLVAKEASGIYLYQWQITDAYESSVVPVAFIGQENKPDIALLRPDTALWRVITAKGDAQPSRLLVFVCHEKAKPELALLLANATTKPAAWPDQLKLSVSVPALKLSVALALPAAAKLPVPVPSGQVGEWRLPWQTVLDAIPPAELAQIMAAGGDLDLVWRIGERDFQILPIKLPPPAPAAPDSPPPAPPPPQ